MERRPAFLRACVKKIERRREEREKINCLEEEEQKERPNHHHHASKSETIKKTIKTEVKAIVHGQERVDKRGKPVTSIADRTNVRAAHKTLFFYSISSFHRVSSLRNERKVFLSWRKCPLLCVCFCLEKRTQNTQKSFSEFFVDSRHESQNDRKKKNTFTTTTIIIIIIIIIVLTPRVFSFFLLFTGVRFEISRAERVRGTGKRVRESVQQRPLPAEGKTHASAAVSVRRRPGQPPRSGVRVRY